MRVCVGGGRKRRDLVPQRLYLSVHVVINNNNNNKGVVNVHIGYSSALSSISFF